MPVIVAWFLVMLALAAQADVAAADPPPAACRELVYAANPSYPPYHWAEGETAYAGASVELLGMVLPAGVTAKPAVLPWRRTLDWARQGKIDLILSLRMTPERSEYLVFAQQRAFPNPIVVFTRSDKPFPFRKWADLKGRKGGISFGDTFGNGFDEYWRGELTIEEAPTMENNFAKLAAGRIDYFVTSRYVGEAYALTNPQGGGVTSLGPPISDSGIHFGFSKASPCAALAAQVSRRLQELERQGVPEQLLKKHLRRYVEAQERSR